MASGCGKRSERDQEGAASRLPSLLLLVVLPGNGTAVWLERCQRGCRPISGADRVALSSRELVIARVRQASFLWSLARGNGPCL